jgi:hypothetical protein
MLLKELNGEMVKGNTVSSSVPLILNLQLLVDLNNWEQ